MRTVLFFAFSLLVTVPALFAQNPAQAQPPAAEARTLQSILEELRRLHQDLQTASATVQRMQILLYRVRNQMEGVARDPAVRRNPPAGGEGQTPAEPAGQ